MKRLLSRRAVAAASLALAGTAGASATDVTVQIQNLSPVNGTFLTPVWVGFHNGGFDLYDLGAPASLELERIAEDGNTGPLMDAFMLSGAGTVQGTIASDTGIPPLAPGETATMQFTLDPNSAQSRYFSYASMIIPSNDAFIANGNPTAHPVFDDQGNFIGADFLVLGSVVRDAGTEVNTELPEHTAFFGQMEPDTGIDENGVVHTHPGFLPPGSGGILDDPMFASADFTADGYVVARITIVPEPASAAALALFGLLGAVRRRA